MEGGRSFSSAKRSGLFRQNSRIIQASRKTGPLLSGLSLDLETDLDFDLKLFNLAVFDSGALSNNLKPIHVADGLGGFGNRGLRSFSKTDG